MKDTRKDRPKIFVIKSHRASERQILRNRNEHTSTQTLHKMSMTLFYNYQRHYNLSAYLYPWQIATVICNIVEKQLDMTKHNSRPRPVPIDCCAHFANVA